MFHGHQQDSFAHPGNAAPNGGVERVKRASLATNSAIILRSSIIIIIIVVAAAVSTLAQEIRQGAAEFDFGTRFGRQRLQIRRQVAIEQGAVARSRSKAGFHGAVV